MIQFRNTLWLDRRQVDSALPYNLFLTIIADEYHIATGVDDARRVRKKRHDVALPSTDRRRKSPHRSPARRSTVLLLWLELVCRTRVELRNHMRRHNGIQTLFAIRLLNTAISWSHNHADADRTGFLCESAVTAPCPGSVCRWFSCLRRACRHQT